jgi:hypothetical protein
VCIGKKEKDKMAEIDAIVHVRSVHYPRLQEIAHAAARDVNVSDTRRPWSFNGRLYTLREAASLVAQAPEALDHLKPIGTQRVADAVTTFYKSFGEGWQSADTGSEAFTGRLGAALSLQDVACVATNVSTGIQTAIQERDGVLEFGWRVEPGHRDREAPIYIFLKTQKYDEQRAVTLDVTAWMYTFTEEQKTSAVEGTAQRLGSDLASILAKMRGSKRAKWLGSHSELFLLEESQKKGDADAIAPLVLQIVDPVLRLANERGQK